jgi:hypothetical protein
MGRPERQPRLDELCLTATQQLEATRLNTIQMLRHSSWSPALLWNDQSSGHIDGSDVHASIPALGWSGSTV